MKDKIREIEQAALAEIGSSDSDRDSLEALRIKYLGRKGILAELFKKMAELPSAEKPEAGQLLNFFKNNLTKALDEKFSSSSELEKRRGGELDITLPGISERLGSRHPITKTINAICDCFISMGFMVVEGPEIETEHYNFEALNIPLEHPSRDAFDTFYLKTESSRVETGKPANRQTGKLLLRSHTSPVQAHFMENNKPPFSIIVPGRVYRPDATDASHSFMFHQVEGLAVSGKIKFSDLKGVLSVFTKQMFGKDTKMRFRPSFFPFTEPSAEVDISCVLCSGESSLTETGKPANRQTGKQHRCSMCGGKGWLEILGAGMVNPKVFENVGYDPKKVAGFAFGMGVERIAILKYGISDIRMFFENDVRFLRQF
ncbi:MAG: phenylalanine--tRNA ligase subunit alpha [Candidatus Omnitrophota bacterium]|nr:phenylalanine--tRNA ligase subunit alpha [Candidatus Omnitrophota bacterium]